MTIRQFPWLASMILLLGGCAPMVATHGHLVPSYQVEQIEPGRQSKGDVLAMLGNPSSTSTFEDNIWYYIGQQTETVAFFAPEIVKHQVVALSFDDRNQLDAMVVLGDDKYQEISPIRKATPTAGKKLGILEQLVGNVGRFNKSKKAKQAEGP